MKINIDGISTLEIIDDSDYKPDISSNGGHYRYWTKYQRIGADTWEVKEHTSGEFCPYCGSWDCCGDCSEPEVISAHQLEKILDEFVEDEEHYIKTH